MRYNEIIESQDDDDDLFGRGEHHRFADAIRAQAEEDQRVADEERGLGDLENAAEFAKQAAIYNSIADAFAMSVVKGVRAYRELPRTWQQAIDDVIDIEFDMDFRDYVKQIPESAGDDELFGRTGGNFAGMSAQDVKDRWDELNDTLYGYEAYWSDEDDAEFQQKESELKSLMRYARIRFGEAFYQYLSNWREHSDAQYSRWQERTRADPFNNRRYREDPRITKSGKINKQDQKTLARDIKDRIGAHKQPVLPENEDDDLFSTSPKLDRRQELKAKAIRRIEKRDALNIQPGTRLMVKWDNGKYYKGKVVRLTPSGRVIAQVKFHNVGWPLEKNISPRDIKPEHILKETDDDMFAKNSQMSQNIKTKLKQIDDPYLRTIGKIRELAKTQFGVKTRVSSQTTKQARGTATFWFGDYVNINGQAPEPLPVAQEIKTELESRGFECKFTGSGWLSVKVPPVFSNLISEESDDELFGQEDSARKALKLLKLLQAAVARDPRGVANMLKQRKDEYSNAEQPVDDTLDYMAQAVGMPRETFDKYADDFFILPWPRDVSMNRPWQIWDAQVLDKIIETMTRVVYGRDMNESKY